MVYYVSEVPGLHSFGKAARITARSLTSAKRVASKWQMFEGTVLYIGEEVDSNGFIVNPLAVKKGSKWKNLCMELDN